ncbi:sugar kinase [Mesorhizobium sp. M3A.F.Ca.ET.201.01.1.1]|uniref:sugar kinase n=1 Tax=Mesorhizobium sp. M3A.F.Ca.ET.201.01.1.1 TaxID=2563946 RepID=UPI001AEE6BE0|nr:sugar kinase [Mesorhizobium sp. M3A.F.Ca.ET.201.01.1.1]
MACEILCLGEPLGEFSQLEPDRFRFGYGGDVANVAVAAVRAGAKAGIVTRLGQDWVGDALVDFWQAEGVGSVVEADPSASTGLYFIRYNQFGHSFDYLRAGSAASRMDPSLLKEVDWDAVKILHVSAISQAISRSALETVARAISIATERGIVISYDTNLRLKLWSLEEARKSVINTLSTANVALPSLDDAKLLFGQDDPVALVDKFLEFGADIVAMTLGADGVLVATAKMKHHLPAHEVDVLDASGAGDCFDGYFLTRYLECNDLLSAARFANAASALTVMRRGAVSAIPFRADVTRFLERANRND